MVIITNILIVIATFFAMEGVAWLAHKYIMHGFLWQLHKDHHQPYAEDGVVQKNDAFFLIFATPAIISFYFGYADFGFLFWLGLGITLYGIAYFFIHDLFIHQRMRVLRNSNAKYLKAIRKAHKVHHKYLSKEKGECFGMLWAPGKYFKKNF